MAAGRTGRPLRPHRARLAVATLGVGSCLLLAACGGSGQTVEQWVRSTSFGESFGTLQADNARIAHDFATTPPAPSTKADCALLVADLSNTAGNLPTPDTQLTNLLDAAYHDDQQAASACVEGVGGQPGALAASVAARIKAEKELVQALARITDLTGSVPPTSTTTTIGSIFG